MEHGGDMSIHLEKLIDGEAVEEPGVTEAIIRRVDQRWLSRSWLARGSDAADETISDREPAAARSRS